jgi:hypothetical protein
MKKKCSKCGQTKPTREFHKDKTKKDGLRSCCKICANQSVSKYRKTEKGRELHRKTSAKYKKSEKGRETFRRSSKKKMTENPHRFWATRTLNNHRIKGNKILISIDELEILAKQSTHCGICGCELMWSYDNKDGKIQPNSPTLDRVDNENIITSDNIQILCRRCNSTKQDRTTQELYDWCKNFVKKFPQLDRLSDIMWRIP